MTKVMSRISEISKLGQSVWYDNIQRKMITDGIFKQMIEEDDLRGVTSNPTIFDKAISKSNDYDDAIARYHGEGFDAEGIYWQLVIKDIQDAADIFLPVYQKTNKLDGYISIEVSPLLARDTENTIKQAKELWAKVNRPNIMIKVPATKEGIPAIENLIYEGINVNVTLIFSIERYKEVMNAYITGLEQRHWDGKTLEGIHSVASFFVSRVDGAIDPKLQAHEQARPYIGKVGIANSQLAYQEFKNIFTSARFQSIKVKKGAVQRPLWASTSTKNPEYSDVMYIEALMGPDSVNTIPPATLDAYKDHGEPKSRIELNLDFARQTIASLPQWGVDLNQITEDLEVKGVESFSASFNELLTHLKDKQDKL